MTQRITVYLLEPKDRPHYQAQWIEPGTTRRRTRSLQTTDPDRAEQLRSDLEYELNHGLATAPGRLSWSAFRQRYCEEKLAGRRAATRAKAGYVFDHFEQVIRPASVQSITSAMLTRYSTHLRAEGYEPTTIAGHLAYLRAALRWAGRHDLIRQVPAVEMPRVPRRRRFVVVAPEQLPRLLAGLPSDEWRLLVQVVWFTGLRRGEVLSLRWDQGEDDEAWIDWRMQRIWIPARLAKSGHEEWVPLHPSLADILKPLRQATGRLFSLSASPREVSRRFGRQARAAGFRIGLHTLRRSFGTRYAPHVPAQTLQRLMRHADIRTTLEYYADLDLALDQAILRA